ncbi:MAG: 3',5'-cyclic adenosine monophosphate phosphodiesterase CpdA [Pelotomaculum sp. PtaU1.Bin035]|nr:MAG: 3',5'-cyclic adenosine monophosphate phosphodiesterase CpdA [Pelotomaculum sp. PtaU1.Bin035]
MLSGTIIKNEELCTVSSNHAVITWVTPKQRANTTICIGEDSLNLVKHTFGSNTEFHWAEVFNLKPSTRYWYQAECNGAHGSLNSFTTLPRPEGKYLFSFALLSDTHISYGESTDDINEKYFGKLVEYSGDLLIQCIADSKKRNIDLAVITGDLTDSARQPQYLGLRNQLLPCFGNTPYFLCIGNHDCYVNDSGMGKQGFLSYVANRENTHANIMFRDYQFLLIDSCRQNDNWGHIDSTQLQWIESILKKGRGNPSFLFLHHPCNGLDTWFGTKNYRDLQKVIKCFPGVQSVFSGHIHRNKITTNQLTTGNLPYVEVAATVQFPCSYAIVRVYENGFEYNSYKVSRLDLAEMSRERFILKHRGRDIYTWYSFGGIGDRSFSYFNGRLYRPEQYELSVIADQTRAVRLYEHAQSFNGASMAPAETGKYKVILGRHELLHLAAQARRQIFSRYSVNARVIREGK